MASETAKKDENGVSTLIGKALTSGEVRNVVVDDYTNSLVSIEVSHAKIHAGTHYQYTDFNTIASAGTQDYMLTTGASKPPHLTFSVQGTLLTTVTLYEAGDRNGTTTQTVYNNNRLSTNTSTTTLHKGTSGGATDGTAIFTIQGGTATGAFAQNSFTRSENEYVLKLNTKYILRVTSGANGNVVSVILNWYEN